MSDLKPTPGTVVKICADDLAALGQCGLSPRQLVTLKAELSAALRRLMRSFPTDSDMAQAGWEPCEIDEACNAHDQARAALAKCQPKPQEVKP